MILTFYIYDSLHPSCSIMHPYIHSKHLIQTRRNRWMPIDIWIQGKTKSSSKDESTRDLTAQGLLK